MVSVFRGAGLAPPSLPQDHLRRHITEIINNDTRSNQPNQRIRDPIDRLQSDRGCHKRHRVSRILRSVGAKSKQLFVAPTQ